MPVRGVDMPRAPRLYAPEATVHGVARGNNWAFAFLTPEDFALVLGKLRGMVRDYALTVYVYTVMSNHVHLLLQAPRAGPLARPLRWCLTETARAFHRARQRRGHFWERRYRACLIEDDTYGLAALRYLALSRDPPSRQRAYAALLAPSADPKADGHDARWTTKRAVGSLGFLARYGARRGRAAKTATLPRNQ